MKGPICVIICLAADSLASLLLSPFTWTNTNGAVDRSIIILRIPFLTPAPSPLRGMIFDDLGEMIKD